MRSYSGEPVLLVGPGVLIVTYKNSNVVPTISEKYRFGHLSVVLPTYFNKQYIHILTSPLAAHRAHVGIFYPATIQFVYKLL